jgi:hypothetical protein
LSDLQSKVKQMGWLKTTAKATKASATREKEINQMIRARQPPSIEQFLAPNLLLATFWAKLFYKFSGEIGCYQAKQTFGSDLICFFPSVFDDFNERWMGMTVLQDRGSGDLPNKRWPRQTSTT